MRERPKEAGVQNYEPEFIPMLLGETETAYNAVQVEGANLLTVTAELALPERHGRE